MRAKSTRRWREIGHVAGHVFDDAQWPLLVSVRSGARASMPGMMDTVLNLGLNDETVEALARNCGDERFAFDCYRRFIEMYSSVVLGVEHHEFEEALERLQGAARASRSTRNSPPTIGAWSSRNISRSC